MQYIYACRGQVRLCAACRYNIICACVSRERKVYLDYYLDYYLVYLSTKTTYVGIYASSRCSAYIQNSHVHALIIFRICTPVYLCQVHKHACIAECPISCRIPYKMYY